ncbi:MAG: hypothetical protein NTW19_05215 [Planctomycetota bacterium]|nr:hypothetical protein [Planctomycetota bacterium]
MPTTPRRQPDRPAARPRFARRATMAAWACLVLGLSFALSRSAIAAPAIDSGPGVITAQLKTSELIAKVWAVRRDERTNGVYMVPFSGSIIDGKLTVAGLPVPGKYDLRFQTESGLVEGWDATVPRSEYVDEQPLSEEGANEIIRKMSKDTVSGFPDQVVLLDLQGNIQNAAALMTGVRTTPFSEGMGVTHGTWIWRVDRWQWESPEDDQWNPYDKRPYYALYRERLKPEVYQAKRVVFARHLGGIGLKEERPKIDLGTILVPRPLAGVRAVNPDGSTTKAIVLKPRPDLRSATQPASTTQPAPAAPPAP